MSGCTTLESVCGTLREFLTVAAAVEEQGAEAWKPLYLAKGGTQQVIFRDVTIEAICEQAIAELINRKARLTTTGDAFVGV